MNTGKSKVLTSWRPIEFPLYRLCSKKLDDEPTRIPIAKKTKKARARTNENGTIVTKPLAQYNLYVTTKTVGRVELLAYFENPESALFFYLARARTRVAKETLIYSFIFFVLFFVRAVSLSCAPRGTGVHVARRSRRQTPRSFRLARVLYVK